MNLMNISSLAAQLMQAAITIQVSFYSHVATIICAVRVSVLRLSVAIDFYFSSTQVETMGYYYDTYSEQSSN